MPCQTPSKSPMRNSSGMESVSSATGASEASGSTHSSAATGARLATAGAGLATAGAALGLASWATAGAMKVAASSSATAKPTPWRRLISRFIVPPRGWGVLPVGCYPAAPLSPRVASRETRRPRTALLDEAEVAREGSPAAVRRRIERGSREVLGHVDDGDVPLQGAVEPIHSARPRTWQGPFAPDSRVSVPLFRATRRRPPWCGPRPRPPVHR